MLRISESEMLVFSDKITSDFRDELFDYVRVEFPDETRDLSQKNIYEIVQLAQKKSDLYEFTEKSDICQYINLMMLFGANFDTNETWAVNILNQEIEQSGAAKMLALYDEAENSISL